MSSARVTVCSLAQVGRIYGIIASLYTNSVLQWRSRFRQAEQEWFCLQRSWQPVAGRIQKPAEGRSTTDHLRLPPQIEQLVGGESFQAHHHKQLAAAAVGRGPPRRPANDITRYRCARPVDGKGHSVAVGETPPAQPAVKSEEGRLRDPVHWPTKCQCVSIVGTWPNRLAAVHW